MDEQEVIYLDYVCKKFDKEDDVLDWLYQHGYGIKDGKDFTKYWKDLNSKAIDAVINGAEITGDVPLAAKQRLKALGIELKKPKKDREIPLLEQSHINDPQGDGKGHYDHGRGHGFGHDHHENEGVY